MTIVNQPISIDRLIVGKRSSLSKTFCFIAISVIPLIGVPAQPMPVCAQKPNTKQGEPISSASPVGKHFPIPKANPDLKQSIELGEETLNKKNSSGKSDQLTWRTDFSTALKQAKEKNQFVFIDFTGERCINCRINEKEIFTRQDVKKCFKQYILLSLYCDSIPQNYYTKAVDEDRRDDDAAENLKLEKKVFQTEVLPLYAIVKPVQGDQFEVIQVHDQGRIKNVEAFLKFLTAPLDKK